MGQLTNYAKTIRVINATAAGVTTINGTSVDMAGFESIRFIVWFGAIVASSVTSIKGQMGLLANGTDAADIAGTNTGPIAAGGADDNKCLILEIYRPLQRFVRVVVLRATANSTIDSGSAELFEGQFFPIGKDTTVSAQKVLTSPALGAP